MSGSRIDARFDRLKTEGRTALIPYIAAGDPSAATTIALMHALVRGGADIVELGVPFSDPSADGPVIQRATERAIRNGVGLAATLDCVAAFRADDTTTPVVLMGYANPFELMAMRLGGLDPLAERVQAVGVDGVLVVDYPPEESIPFADALKRVGIAAIYLLAPTSTDARIEAVARAASGYIYYVSLKGITGSAALDVASIADKLPLIRAQSDVPIGVGFGIRDAASACAVAALADAVVIGSRIIEAVETAPAGSEVAVVETFIRGVREALDARTRAPG
ncbi:MAG: tryptophan synthase subunit alpha [Burkholderiaceae bacterium]